MKIKNSYLITGPLAEIEDRLLEFSSNMFTSVLLSESIIKLEKLEDEYCTALSGSSEDEIKQKEMMLKACEASFQIVCSMLEAPEEI
jgi:hypothetical protein